MERPYLSVIVPAHREEQRILPTLQAICSFLRAEPWSYEIIVVDDGSPDQTKEVVRRFQKLHEPRLRLLEHQTNRGKGAAVRTGMAAAHGTYTLFTDADNATPITELPKLLTLAVKGSDVVIGSRYLPESRVVRRQSLFRRFMSRGGNFLFRILLGLKFTDTRCGFKIFNERARQILLPRLQLERWGFDTELLVVALRHHLSVREVPVIWYDQQRGNIHPIRDSFRSLAEIYHIRRHLQRGSYD